MSPPEGPAENLTVIILIGMMGVGKSTVGKILADHYSVAFEDLDERLMTIDLFNRPASKILNEDGQSVFRAIEHRALQTWLATADTRGGVLATGGGVIVQDYSRQTLKESAASIICLEANVQVLASRIRMDEQNVRPLLGDPHKIGLEARITEILNQRSSHYEALANLVIQTNDLNPADCARIIVERLELS